MTELFHLSIPRHLYARMLTHARAALPAECCGLLAGTIANGVGQVTQHLPLVNALASPTEYESEPRSMLAAVKAMRASGTRELAVYHSHPSSDPVPSARDRERNYSEGVVNIIIGVRAVEPEVRAWWLKSDGAHEARFELVD